MLLFRRPNPNIIPDVATPMPLEYSPGIIPMRDILDAMNGSIPMDAAATEAGSKNFLGGATTTRRSGI
jgi:hypothetical protein